MMDMFVTAIRTNTRPMIDGEEGYKAVNVILAAMESARSGKRVKVKN
jgi:predicted dehydrogenase